MAVQSITRAFDILDTVAAHPAGIGVTAIARATRLHKSTVSRLLATLEGVEAVARVADSSEFTINPALVERLTAAAHPSLVTLARPLLLSLHAAVGEDIGLAVPDGDFALYVDQVSGDQAVQVKDWTGERFPLHTTSAGKVILAYQPEAFVRAYTSRPLVTYTPNTMATPADLAAAIETVRCAGHDWSFGEFDEALNAAAAPVFDRRGRVVAALNIYGPRFRFPGPNRQTELGRLLVETAAALTAQVVERLP